jgi:hypothetical protein
MEEKEQFPWEEPTTTPQPHTPPLPSPPKKKKKEAKKERRESTAITLGTNTES